MQDQNLQLDILSESNNNLNHKCRRFAMALGQNQSEARGNLSLEHGNESTLLGGGGCWYGKDELLLKR